MRQLFFTLLAAIILPSLATSAQELPQFTYTDFDGWTYNNPGVPLNAESIGGSKIALYRNTNGLVLMLKSEPFGCQGIDSIAAKVNWKTPNISNPDFVLSRTALTLAIDDADGNPIDSVTIVPSTPGVSQHILDFIIAVPPGLDTISMRFVSWEAVVSCCGIIQRALFEAISSTQQQPIVGDLDGDNMLSVGDVTMLISKILNGATDQDIRIGDMDGSGQLDVADVTALIQQILSA